MLRHGSLTIDKHQNLCHLDNGDASCYAPREVYFGVKSENDLQCSLSNHGHGDCLFLIRYVRSAQLRLRNFSRNHKMACFLLLKRLFKYYDINIHFNMSRECIKDLPRRNVITHQTLHITWKLFSGALSRLPRVII